MNSRFKGTGEEPIWLSDGPKKVAHKVNKYAFSGGQPSVEEHRNLGGNPDIDVSFLYLKYFFEEDDRMLKEVEERYRSGDLLSGELKAILIKNINKFLAEHKRRRVEVENHLEDYILK
jgi:tryptophanyl-tRNA synthetase